MKASQFCTAGVKFLRHPSERAEIEYQHGFSPLVNMRCVVALLFLLFSSISSSLPFASVCCCVCVCVCVCVFVVVCCCVGEGKGWEGYASNKSLCVRSTRPLCVHSIRHGVYRHHAHMFCSCQQIGFVRQIYERG